MSRTYRRKSGDRTFADLNAKNVQNPWHCTPRFIWKRVSKEVITGVRISAPYKATRYWYDTVYSWEVVGWNEPRSSGLEFKANWATKFQRDHKRGNRIFYKKVCSKLRREDAKIAIHKSLKTGDTPVLTFAGTYRDWGYY